MIADISPFESPIIARELSAHPLCVADVGAAGGIDSLWKRLNYSRFLKFYGFEPNPENLSKLEDDANTKYFEMAISDTRGTADFYAFKTYGSLRQREDRERLKGEKYKKIKVRKETLEWLRQSGTIESLDAVKIDVERTDFEVIEGIGKYLASEVLYLQTEFSFKRNEEKSNFARIDDLLTRNGMLLFDFNIHHGFLGELEGGNVIYLKSIADLLASKESIEHKLLRVLKLITICFFTRNYRYAYVVTRAAVEAGVLTRAEGDEVCDVIHRRVFLPIVFPKLPFRYRLAHILSLLSQIVSGRLALGRGAPSDNRLERYRQIFVDSRFVPARGRAKHHAWLERSYSAYEEVLDLWYSGPGADNS